MYVLRGKDWYNTVLGDQEETEGSLDTPDSLRRQGTMLVMSI